MTMSAIEAKRSINCPLAGENPGKPLRFVFVLLDEFSYLTFSCAIEALRLANEYQRVTRYEWQVLSETGSPVRGSNGLALMVDGPLRPISGDETLIVCGGDHITKTTTPKLVFWLRQTAGLCARLGGMSTGAFALAKAGFLSNTKATLHWEYHAAFRELFPHIELLDTIYHYDGKRFTCAGCAASMDMMLHLIADDCGNDVATQVADLMVYTSPRSFGYAQRRSFLSRSGSRNTKLSYCLELMSDQIEEPLSLEGLARKVGVSRRQLQRLFRKHLKNTPNSYYTSMRLERARALLLQTELSVTEVCVATGFKSPPHFTRSYREKFGVLPSREAGIRSRAGS